ncbi:MAG: HAMP domain-containing protein [Candidatus Binatia bacterium]
MNQERPFSQSQKPARVGRRVGLKWKIIGGLLSGVLLFGVLVLLVVNYQMSQVLRNQLDLRALDIATNLSDSAAGHVLKGNALDVHALASKYALLPGVAYTLVRDGKGKVIAHSLGTLPQELRESSSPPGQRQATQRELPFRGRSVYETNAPILEGRIGSVSVGIWAHTVEDEIRRAILPLVGVIAIALTASLLFAVLVTQGITGRVLRLKELADKVSLGDLETPVGIDSNDEIGDLAHALERMRASLKAAMARLSRT